MKSVIKCAGIALVLSILSMEAIVFSAVNSSVEEIVSKSELVHPGKDQRSKLTFIIKEVKGPERKIILRRFWKNYKGEKGISSKTIIFYEYPPEEKGQSFMTWSYNPQLGKKDDRWIYLPILRQVQKVPEKIAGGFQAIDFRPEDMAPRPVEIDEHRLLDEEVIDNKPYYVIETTPKGKSPDQIYSKWVTWISQDQFLKEKIAFYDLDEKLWKEQVVSWKKVGGAWVWEKVRIENKQTNVVTILNITEIQVNSNLADKFFTERTMKLGPGGIP